MRKKLFVIVSTLLSLSGCLGGGGSNDTTISTNAAPLAKQVVLNDSNGGSAQVGDVLTGSYTYSDAEQDAEGSSTFRWLRSGTLISGATAKTYTLVTADIGATIQFAVTPVAATGTLTGTEVKSSASGVVEAKANSAPVASNVALTGNATVGQTLTGSYTYSDADNDAEGSSTFKWLRNGTAISGATARTYTLVTADIDATLQFAVTPVAVAGQLTGTEIKSAPSGKVAALGDPLTSQQWHLGKINVEGAHACAVNANTCRGEGILVGVLDDGVEIAHEDLRANIAPRKSRNFNVSDNTQDSYYDPTPAVGTAQQEREEPPAHGTAVAGIIAAVDQNGLGVTGIAPRAQLAGFNILATNTTGASATALGNKDLYVSNNSWGPTDNVCIYQDDEALNAQAIQAAVVGAEAARGGKGAIVLFASGNGGENCDPNKLNELGITVDAALLASIGGDQSSMDGPNNNRYVISVAALANDATNTKAVYAERGTNILVAAPSGNYCNTSLPTLVTTDLSANRGYNRPDSTGELPLMASNLNYTSCMNGTSGATPVAAGVVTLILQANPNLAWRDVRAILAKTTTQNDSSSTEWQTNTVSGLKVHPYYGYGMVNAVSAVALAKTWVNLPTEVSLVRTPNQELVPGDNGSSEATHAVDIADAAEAGFNTLETLQVEVEFNHQRAGDIELVLEHRDASNALISSEYLVKLNADPTNSVKTITFTSTQHLYDTPVGKWVLKVNDRYAGNTGKVQWKSIKFFGHQNAS
ncbi:MAG: S8 family serine peptidase [Thiofilum sp.]|uniref:S8 family serine peptidase n=1 Tax=Thiofilum sp. TaxID=2212733 RepID=UPI0025FFAAAC|nr:S8 family serine peptidase [Thiofilum sp.]MBK8454091.1 S8 family serine peptidase [Thiofilum sp.]